MKVLVVGKVGSPEKFRLRQEAEKRGHNADSCVSGDLVIICDTDSFQPTLNGTVPLSNYDLIYFWSLGYKRWEWHTAGKYLNKKHGTIVVDGNTISDGYNFSPTPTLSYMLQTLNGLPYPKTALLFSSGDLKSVDKSFQFPLIVKDSMIHQGKGVRKVENYNELKKIVEKSDKPRPMVIREFIPNDGDIRVIVINNKAIGAMKRIPKKDDFRSNISLGGTGEGFDLDKRPQIQSLAEKAARVIGVNIAGVDIIINKNTQEPYILEINEGLGYSGFEKYTSINVAGKIIEYFEELYKNKVR